MTSPVVQRGSKWVTLTPAGVVKNSYESKAAAEAAVLLEQHGFQFGAAE